MKLTPALFPTSKIRQRPISAIITSCAAKALLNTGAAEYHTLLSHACPAVSSLLNRIRLIDAWPTSQFNLHLQVLVGALYFRHEDFEEGLHAALERSDLRSFG